MFPLAVVPGVRNTIEHPLQLEWMIKFDQTTTTTGGVLRSSFVVTSLPHRTGWWLVVPLFRTILKATRAQCALASQELFDMNK